MGTNPGVCGSAQGCGFLLCHAVEGPESPGEVEGVDTDDFAIGVSVLKNLQGDVVGWVLEGGNDESTVDENIVAVAGGESIVVEESGCGQWKWDWVKRLSATVVGCGDGVEVSAEQW